MPKDVHPLSTGPIDDSKDEVEAFLQRSSDRRHLIVPTMTGQFSYEAVTASLHPLERTR